MSTLGRLRYNLRWCALAGSALLLLAPRLTRADEAGDMLARRVAGRLNAMQPLVCDYTVTYRLGSAARNEKHHAYRAGTMSGHSSEAQSLTDDLPPDASSSLFMTLDFLPRFESVFSAGTKPPLNVETRYAGKENWKGATYELVDVTTPLQPITGDPPTQRVTLRWYVGEDSLIHRITARLPQSDAPVAPPGREAGAAKRGQAGNPHPASAPVLPSRVGRPAAGDKVLGKDAKAPAAPPAAAPPAMILVEAVSEGARKSVMPAPRPPTNPPLPPRLTPDAQSVSGLTEISPDGRLLAVVHDDSSVALYDATTGAKTVDIVGHSAPVPHKPLTTLQFADGSRLLVSADSAGVIRVWDTTTGLLRREIKMPGDIFSGLCVSPDGAFVGAFNSTLGMLYVWNIATGAALPPISVGSIQTAAFSPDATRFVTINSVEMALWDRASGKAILRVPYVGGPFLSLPAAWSPDGRRYVWMRSDGGLVVCDGQTGAQIRELKGAAGGVNALAFAPDGKTLLGVDTDQRGDIPTNKPGLVIWNTTNWTVQEARELAGARTSGFQNAPILAPAGRRLLLRDNEGLQLWDLAETLPPISAKL